MCHLVEEYLVSKAAEWGVVARLMRWRGAHHAEWQGKAAKGGLRGFNCNKSSKPVILDGQGVGEEKENEVW